MKIILITLLLISSSAFAQRADIAVANAIKKADSVLLISHTPTKEHGYKKELLLNEDGTFTTTPDYPSLLTNGYINDTIVVEKKRLDSLQRKALAYLISWKVPTYKIVSLANCFEPRHAVLVYKAGKMSYIDICFTCRRLCTSDNFELDEAYFNSIKWERLRKYFVVAGLNYELRNER